ncbi:hypothetical protein BJ085DRAFT_35848 [Dimargaris cristalligena]|uniref:F-box domain-containing protein n=1 Tax=Dimargaris cristalligena TaxID=215637 RepID=A0A4P9ZRH7_9FUNG|nr:hypothetical protein BJ085DRAFT_35848 [Dimargaris cristalligena]|eukprot:RKP36136.1 hypothetical protein BJ085DRAFT_35848 [Dimargaris cristalligena]
MSINPMDMFSAELQQLLVSHVASHDKLTATNVNQQWRGIFLQETNARNAKAMDKFMLNPASYLPEGSSPAVLDSKLQDFSPLKNKINWYCTQ